MYTKLVIVTLLQVSLAQRLTLTNYEDQLTYGHPDSENPTEHKDVQYGSGVLSGYNLHLDKNDVTNADYQRNSKVRDGSFHTRTGEQTHRRTERSGALKLTNNEQRRQNLKINSNSGVGLGDSDYANVSEVTRVTARSTQHGLQNNQDTLKTNLDSQRNVRRGCTSDRSTKCNTQITGESHQQGIENEVAAKESSTKPDTHNSGFVTQPYGVESTVVYTKGSRDGQSKISNNNNSTVLMGILKSTASGKTTVEDDVRYNNNGNGDKKKDDKWVWDKTNTTNNSNETKKTDLTIDDRILFDVDACPKGQVKVDDVCLDKH